MKGLIVQRLALGLFATLVLAFGVQGVVDAEDETVPIAGAFDIVISEIMYATNVDKSPQWLELHNRSGQKVSLEGWEVTIRNHPEDKSVLAPVLTFTLDAKILDRNQVLLLVTEQGSHSGVGTAKADIQPDRVIILKELIGGTPGYRLLSETAFKVTVKAPAGVRPAHKMRSDIAGNLGAVPAWKLPLIEGNQRSSIIRAYDGKNVTSEPFDGTIADGWELSSKKGSLFMEKHTAYYGHRDDHGTPGYRVIFPVELSKFRPELKIKESRRVVVIRWITESEVNCAGFHIKRSETRNGAFKSVNPTMIPGAGTTDKRQSYIYVDKTAKPNVVYYYQLECVSVDGTRQTLHTTHLKVHKGLVKDYLRFEEAPFWWKDLNK